MSSCGFLGGRHQVESDGSPSSDSSYKLCKKTRKSKPQVTKGQKKSSFLEPNCVLGISHVLGISCFQTLSPALFYRNSSSDQERVNTSLSVRPQMRGQARIPSCLLSTSAASPGSVWLQPEQMARALTSMSASQELSPHSYQYQQSYGTKTEFFKIRKSPFVCPCYSCRPSQHIQWYFHMCMFRIHIFHIFTFFIIVPLTPDYSINYYESV